MGKRALPPCLTGRQSTSKTISFQFVSSWKLQGFTMSTWLIFCIKRVSKFILFYLPKPKDTCKASRYRSKNDKIDAQGLAVMGLQQTFKAWQPCSTQIYTLRSLTRQLEALQNSKTVFNNELEAATYSAFSSEIVTKSLQSLIGSVEEQIRFAKKEIERIITDDPVFSAKYKLIEPIKGMGLITFATIVAETGGFELFNSRSQLVCYAGYDVIENQSGKRVGKTRISKKGNTHIRRIMHMASLNMVRYKEPVFSGLYERVFDRTKIKMKAYVAVQRKLLCLFYTLWKNNTVYEPDYLESKEKALLLET